MGTFDEIYKRILFASNCQTQMELASVLEISQSSISDAKRRQSIPSDWLIKLYDKFGVNPDWLRDKEEPMYLRGLANIDENGNGYVMEDASRGFICKVVNTFGVKTENTYKFEPIEEIVLPKNLQKCSNFVFNYNALGMEPSIPRPALVGVITAVNNNQFPIISGELYALFLPQEGVIFRRVFHNIDNNSYTLCFDNEKLPSSTINHESFHEKLLGKVAWILHKF